MEDSLKLAQVMQSSWELGKFSRIISLLETIVQNNGQLGLCVVMVFKVSENVFIVSLYMFSYFLVKRSLLLGNNRTGIYSLSQKYLKSY